MPQEYTGRVNTSKPGTGGGWWIPLVEAGIQAAGSYFGAKASKPEEDWEKRLQMEMQLEKMRHTLPAWAYRILKKELSQPLMPHGKGVPNIGGFKELMENIQPAVRTQPTAGVNLGDYFQRGQNERFVPRQIT